MKTSKLSALIGLLVSFSLAVQPAAAAAPKITLDNLDKTWTIKVALANVKAKLNSLPSTTLSPEIITSPTVVPAEKKLEAKLLIPSMRLFQKYFAPQKYQVVMFTNKDRDWADEALKTYGGMFPYKVSDEIIKVSEQGKCNFAFATTGKNNVPIYYGCTDTRGMRDISNYQNPPHEYFHLVQQALAGARMPAWLNEGSAAFFGEAIGYASEKDPVRAKRNMNINTSHDFDPYDKGFDPNRFVKWSRTVKAAELTRIFKRLETDQVSNIEGNKLAYYTLGSIATEALVATFGFEGFMKIFPALRSSGSFDAAFKDTFGLTPNEFYAKLAPYLNKRG